MNLNSCLGAYYDCCVLTMIDHVVLAMVYGLVFVNTFRNRIDAMCVHVCSLCGARCIQLGLMVQHLAQKVQNQASYMTHFKADVEKLVRAVLDEQAKSMGQLQQMMRQLLSHQVSTHWQTHRP